MNQRQRFGELLERSSAELFEDNPEKMTTGALIPTSNVVGEGDLDEWQLS